MQSQDKPRARRVHDAQFKAKVLAECRQPGASVAAVALAHGLNANVVHKWRRGQGLQRAGLMDDATAQVPQGAVEPAASLQFVPIPLSAPGKPHEAAAAPWPAEALAQPASAQLLQIELRRGANQVTVRWPATQAAQCTQWLRELSAAVLGTQQPMQERAP